MEEITHLFFDLGGVCLTNAWDHVSREQEKLPSLNKEGWHEVPGWFGATENSRVNFDLPVGERLTTPSLK